MDASRYFEEMHRAMSAQKNNSSLLLTVKVQDLGGADAYLELRQSPNGRARVFYSTMGRRNLNFQLFRKGWQLCHNASGEMTGQFPTRAENLLDSADFSACIRDDTLDAGRTEIILRELRRAAGTSRSCLPQSAREGAMITVESFVGRGGEWNYWSTRAADCLQQYIEQQGMQTGRKGNNVWCLGPGFDLKRPTLLLNSHIDTVKPV